MASRTASAPPRLLEDTTRAAEPKREETSASSCLLSGNFADAQEHAWISRHRRGCVHRLSERASFNGRSSCDDMVWVHYFVRDMCDDTPPLPFDEAASCQSLDSDEVVQHVCIVRSPRTRGSQLCEPRLLCLTINPRSLGGSVPRVLLGIMSSET